MRALAVLAIALVSGCLSNTYQVPRGELARLAATAPEQRGDSVRVVQELGDGSRVAAQPSVGVETQVVIVPRPVVIVTGDGRGPRGGGHGSGGGGGGSGGGKGGDGDTKADDAKAAVILAVAVAAGAGIVLAATEGQRYDGWVRLHPMHPVHVWGPWGYGVVPLAQLDAGTAATATRAVIHNTEGPWTPLRRAPLDRTGLTYSVLGGVGEIDGADGRAAGPQFHVQLGYYPVHAVGVQLAWTPAWRSAGDENIVDQRVGLELDYLPLDAGILHGGGYLNLAYGWRYDADDTDTGVFTGGGAKLQIGITTRLALTARFGITRAYGELARDATFGVSVY